MQCPKIELPKQLAVDAVSVLKTKLPLLFRHPKGAVVSDCTVAVAKLPPILDAASSHSVSVAMGDIFSFGWEQVSAVFSVM